MIPLPRPFPAASLLACALALTASLPCEAQEPGPPEPSVFGRVVDARTGAPLAGARVAWNEGRRAALTDEAGRFRLPDVDAGEGTLAVDHYGYLAVEWGVRVSGATEVGDLRLEPDPLLVEGVTVVADRLAAVEQRLRNRRNAVPFAVRALDQRRLMNTGARDLREFLRWEGGLQPAACPRGAIGTGCIFRRGRAVSPRVYIDDAPAVGGLEQLATYRPHELYLVEVFSRGAEIRAYTHFFIERMVRRPRSLMPIVW